jgi:hypothetical protein
MSSDFAFAADPVTFARARLGFFPDPAQAAVLRSFHPRRLLCCSRQWGKSTVTALLAVHRLLYGPPGALVLVLAPSLRQSSELFFKARSFLDRLGVAPRRRSLGARSLLLPNGARLVALPGQEATVRGFSAVSFLIVDEAARVPDELYFAVRPMLAATSGDLLLLSTPYGQRGFFFDIWRSQRDRWHCFSVPATRCPRISPAFLAEERRALSDWWFRQEYLCEFAPTGAEAFPADLIERAFRPEVELL